jgi:hypothetical protein
MNVLYICDKKRDACHEDGRVCFEDCYLTTDPACAKNGPCPDPENHPERFFLITCYGGEAYEERKAYRRE